MWQLLRLTELHEGTSKKRLTTTVQLGMEVHSDVVFRKWAIAKTLEARESLSAPFLAHVHRPPKRSHVSDASLEAVGGYYPEPQFFCQFTLPGDGYLRRIYPKGASKRTMRDFHQPVKALWDTYESVCDPHGSETPT